MSHNLETRNGKEGEIFISERNLSLIGMPRIIAENQTYKLMDSLRELGKNQKYLSQCGECFRFFINGDSQRALVCGENGKGNLLNELYYLMWEGNLLNRAVFLGANFLQSQGIEGLSHSFCHDCIRKRVRDKGKEEQWWAEQRYFSGNACFGSAGEVCTLKDGNCRYEWACVKKPEDSDGGYEQRVRLAMLYECYNKSGRPCQFVQTCWRFQDK